jgi:hypothetical protein
LKSFDGRIVYDPTLDCCMRPGTVPGFWYQVIH